ncbi:MAG: flagellar export protein FliJ [Dehalococcoidia bacterium]
MAKPFRLQALLDQKRREEDEAMRALGAHEGDLRRATETLEILREAEETQLRHLDDLARAERFDAEISADATAYLERVEHSIAAQRGAIEEAEARVAESRDALMEVLKEKRALERLREQHLEHEAREAGLREAREVDDITTARYTRHLQERG